LSGILPKNYKTIFKNDLLKDLLRLFNNDALNEIKDDVIAEIYKMFKVGQRYTKSDIKDSLNNLYQRLGYQKKAKATDLELYYIMKYVKFQDSANKWVNGFEIIGKR
jgi:plasmid replication initiation protein